MKCRRGSLVERALDRGHGHSAIGARHDVARGGCRLGHAGCHCRVRSTGVGAKPQTQRLERQHVLQRDVGQVDVGPNSRISQACWSLRGASKRTRSTPPTAATAAATRRHGSTAVPVDPDRPALPTLGDDPAGPGGEVAGHLIGPLLGGEDLLGVLAADLDSTTNLRRPANRSCFSDRVMAATPRETSTLSNPTSAAQSRHCCALPCAQEISSSVPPRQERTPCLRNSSSFSGSPVDVGRAPAELPHVHGGPPPLQRLRPLTRRQSLVEHVGQAHGPGFVLRSAG